MIRIYGCSDDLVEIESEPKGTHTDEIGAYDKPRTITIAAKGGPGGLRVIAEYAPGDAAVWRMSVEPLDEDVIIPWPVAVKLGGRGYSCEVAIHCAEETVVVTHDGPKEES
jgi:hypothetical protein